MYLGKGLSAVAAIALGFAFTTAGMAQGKQLTTEDYARAEKFMMYNVNPLVYHTVDNPTWLPDGRFWYRDRDANGVTFILVDPAKGTKAPAFDQAKLANALSAATPAAKHKVDAQHLPVTELAFEGTTTVVTAHGKQFRCDLTGAGVCTPTVAASNPETPAAAPRHKAP